MRPLLAAQLSQKLLERRAGNDRHAMVRHPDILIKWFGWLCFQRTQSVYPFVPGESGGVMTPEDLCRAAGTGRYDTKGKVRRCNRSALSAELTARR